MLSPKENGIQSDLCYITKKETTSCFIATLHFRILPAHLWMTAFANSHLKVLRQCNAAIISAVRICGNLLGQICQETVSFSVQMSFESILYAFSSVVYMYPVLVGSCIIFVVPPRPGGIAAACGREPIRCSRLRGSNELTSKRDVCPVYRT